MPGTWTWEAGQDPGRRDGLILGSPGAMLHPASKNLHLLLALQGTPLRHPVITPVPLLLTLLDLALPRSPPSPLRWASGACAVHLPHCISTFEARALLGKS